jgi:hypothetical protein
MLAFAEDERHELDGYPLNRLIDPGVIHQIYGTKDITGSGSVYGVEFAFGQYWLTAGGMTSDVANEPNYLFRVSPSGNLMATYIQPTASARGWRDLTHDANYLYGSDGATIDQIDPNTGTTTGVTIPSPVSLARGLAYNPNTDHFFVVNFTSDIYEITRTGAIVDSWTNTHAIYGLACEPWTLGGPYLWGFHQDDMADAVQIDATTGVPTGWEFRSTLPGIAGGFDLSTAAVPGKLVALGIMQATTYGEPTDYLVLFDVTPAEGIVPTMGTAGLIALMAGLMIVALVYFKKH